MIVGRGGFPDVGLEEKAVGGDVGFAGGEALEDLDVAAAAAAELERTRLVNLAVLREDDGEIEEGLQAGFLDGDGHRVFGDGEVGFDGEARAPAGVGIGEDDAGGEGLGGGVAERGEPRQRAGGGRAAVVGVERDGLADVDAGVVALGDRQIDPDLGEIGDDVERGALGDGLTGVDFALDDDPCEGRAHLDGGEGLIGLEERDDFAGGDGIAERFAGLADETAEAGDGAAEPVGVEFDRAIDGELFAEGGGAGRLGGDAGAGGDSGATRGPKLLPSVLPVPSLR